MVDVITRRADGRRYRERRRLSVRLASAAQRWGEDRERHLLQHGPPQAKKEVPTLEQSAPRFVDGHVRANRQKPSGIAATDSILRVHLVPLLGSRRLDAISNERVQCVKRQLADRAPKTVNNVLTVLSVMLKTAVEWGVLDRMPCTIRLLPLLKPTMGFYDFDQYERLVEAATPDPTGCLIMLLGGEAGLRCGEMIALGTSGIHRLRHTFCSHLAMRGAPAKAIQELAGHQDLATTQRYMHLSPAAVESAIQLLDAPGGSIVRGNMMATGSAEIGKSR
jgi:integrase